MKLSTTERSTVSTCEVTVILDLDEKKVFVTINGSTLYSIGPKQGLIPHIDLLHTPELGYHVMLAGGPIQSEYRMTLMTKIAKHYVAANENVTPRPFTM